MGYGNCIWLTCCTPTASPAGEIQSPWPPAWRAVPYGAADRWRGPGAHDVPAGGRGAIAVRWAVGRVAAFTAALFIAAQRTQVTQLGDRDAGCAACLTLIDENYVQPDLPTDTQADVAKVCYEFASYIRNSDGGYNLNSLEEIALLGSGASLTEVVKAAQLLAAQGVNMTVYSVTSWSERARDGRACQQRQFAGDTAMPIPFIAQQLPHHCRHRLCLCRA